MSTSAQSFDEVLKPLLDSIENRDIESYKSHITKNDTMYTNVFLASTS